MADVFISFKSEEQDRARRVARALEGEGLSVWWAAHLASGQTYPAEIERQLRSAKVVVVLWSPAAVESLWVRAEATLALDRAQLMPAMMEACAVPLPFNVLHTVDLTEWQGEAGHAGWQGLLRAIVGRVGETKQNKAASETSTTRASDLEAIYWSTIKAGQQRSGYESYLVRYPNGRFAAEARLRLQPWWWRKSAFASAGAALVVGAAWLAAPRLGREPPAGASVTSPTAVPASPPGSAAVVPGDPVAAVREEGPAPGPKPAPKASEPAPDPKLPVAPAPRRSTVPDVRGLDPDQAAQRLSEARLAEGRRFALTLRNRSPGHVYHQKPEPGSQVLRGTAVDLWLARAHPPAVQHAGHVAMRHTQVVDLDGTSSGREGPDIRLDAADATNRLLQPRAPARLAAASASTLRPADCALAAFSMEPLRLHVGQRLCLLTDESRLSLIRVADIGEEVTIDFETAQLRPATAAPPALAPAPEPGLRSLTLRDQDSPNLASGTTHKLSGGDFYVTIDRRNGAASFWANNQGQQGLVDMGSLPGQPLRSLALPATGYNQFGVPVVEGHVYVAKALEPSRHVVMRVRSLSLEAVVLEVVYR